VRVAYWFLDVIDDIGVAARDQRVVTLTSTCDRPTPLADDELVPVA
jgi:hypothetical protein